MAAAVAVVVAMALPVANRYICMKLRNLMRVIMAFPAALGSAVMFAKLLSLFYARYFPDENGLSFVFLIISSVLFILIAGAAAWVVAPVCAQRYSLLITMLAMVCLLAAVYSKPTSLWGVGVIVVICIGLMAHVVLGAITCGGKRGLEKKVSG